MYIYLHSFSFSILLGAMAERTSLNAYVVFSLLNTIVYCIPAHWVWGSTGFLYKLGCIDIAGSGAVHLLGAASAMVCIYLDELHWLPVQN